MLFWRRRPIHPGPVMLLEPTRGAVTPPLQQFQLEGFAEAEPEELDSDGLARPANTWWNPQLLSPDRSLPQPVTFRWLPPPGLRRGVRYDLRVSTAAESAAPLVLPGLAEPTARVRHLWVNCDYSWQVIALVDGEPVAESAESSFRTHAALPRWIRVPHITNVRDLGGWEVPGGLRVRQGLAYRSSEMNGHLALSTEGAAVLLDELGIRTDLDLRGPDENPSPALPEQWVRYANLPIRPYSYILAPETMSAFAEFFALLAEADTYPVLLHCWAGADRAATAALLVHAALGVALPDLEFDYELSSLSLWGERSCRGPDFRALLAALRTYAQSATDSVNQQVVNYLRAAGVADGTVLRLRELLLEPLPPPPPSQAW
jgi:hypothetical protein